MRTRTAVAAPSTITAWPTITVSTPVGVSVVPYAVIIHSKAMTLSAQFSDTCMRMQMTAHHMSRVVCNSLSSSAVPRACVAHQGKAGCLTRSSMQAPCTCARLAGRPHACLPQMALHSSNMVQWTRPTMPRAFLKWHSSNMLQWTCPSTTSCRTQSCWGWVPYGLAPRSSKAV